MRALRIRDENAPPSLPAGKTIHQRNKSTPALSTLMQVGGLKAAATKRTVFADVSNTVRQPIVKDDMQVPGKHVDLSVLKDPAIVSVKELEKPAALLRPAQRPLANLLPKSNASNGANATATTAPKHSIVDGSLASANIRKVLAKKATTVFKESHSDPITEVSSTIPTAEPVQTRRPHVARSKSNLNTEHAPAVVEPTDKALAKETAALLLPSERYAESQPHDAPLAAELKERVVEEKVTKVEVEIEEAQDSYEYLDALEEQARVIEQEHNEEIAKSQALGRLDQEEYWDDEEDDEYYDADGYTTARSLRSRGDNTTGGVTVALVPRITSKSQRELETARQYVEAHKSPEDIEDEQWDTSMVAEYGEEIFEYMHELEVSRVSINFQYILTLDLGTHEAECNVHGPSG